MAVSIIQRGPGWNGGAASQTLDIRTLHKDIVAANATANEGGIQLAPLKATATLLARCNASGFGGEDIGRLPQILSALCYTDRQPPSERLLKT